MMNNSKLNIHFSTSFLYLFFNNYIQVKYHTLSIKLTAAKNEFLQQNNKKYISSCFVVTKKKVSRESEKCTVQGSELFFFVQYNTILVSLYYDRVSLFSKVIPIIILFLIIVLGSLQALFLLLVDGEQKDSDNITIFKFSKFIFLLLFF